MLTYNREFDRINRTWGNDNLRAQYAARTTREAWQVIDDVARRVTREIAIPNPELDPRFGQHPVKDCDDMGLTLDELIRFGEVHARRLGTNPGLLGGAVNYARHMLTAYDSLDSESKEFSRDRYLQWIGHTWPELAHTCKQQSQQRWDDQYGR